MNSPGLAAVLSFFWAGLGQIYNGQIIKGLLTMLLQAINVALMWVVIGFVLWPIVWLWAMYDAYATAQRMNQTGFRS